MPKFRGNSDDWLDENKKVGQTNSKKKPASKSVELPHEKSNATVAEVFQNQCRVRLDFNFKEVLCSYRRTQVAGSKEHERGRSPVVVGDRVLAQVSGSSGVVEGVCKRKNQMTRLAPSRETAHIIAANIDFSVIVVSAEEPAFASGFLDRLLVYSEFQKIEPLICVTKLDLVEANHDEHPWEVYSKIGYRVIEVSVQSEKGLDVLRDQIQDKVALFCGQSGVGKTSLLRALTRRDFGKVGGINPQTAKGRHTTTNAVLLPDVRWIDSPGVKEFGLKKEFLERLPDLFPEFRNAGCKNSECRHQLEEGCRVKEFPRYKSYIKILKSLEAGEG